MSAADFDWAEAAQARRWSTSIAEKVLRAFADSGLSRVDFAARHGIHEQRLYQWQRRLSATIVAPTAPATFRELARPAGTAEEQPSPFELVLPSGMTLRIPASFESPALSQLLQVLRRVD